MAVAWRKSLPQAYAGPAKWGTGVNPIHGTRGGPGRNIAPGPYNPGPNTGLVSYDYGFTPEDDTYYVGADHSFMDAHPNLDDPNSHAQTGGFPPYGPRRAGVSGGTNWRSYKVGMAWKEQEAQVLPSGTVNAGWLNKPHGEILDARSADDAQLLVQTSYRQRDLSKGNDLAQIRGTDDARTPIATRLVGMKAKTYAGEYRHDEMTPREINQGARPFLFRTAGTAGPPSGVNDMYVSEPMTREVPADVYQGQSEVAIMDTTYEDDGYFV